VGPTRSPQSASAPSPAHRELNQWSPPGPPAALLRWGGGVPRCEACVPLPGEAAGAHLRGGMRRAGRSRVDDLAVELHHAGAGAEVREQRGGPVADERVAGAELQPPVAPPRVLPDEKRDVEPAAAGGRDGADPEKKLPLCCVSFCCCPHPSCRSARRTLPAPRPALAMTSEEQALPAISGKRQSSKSTN
jgi:hypothetical protein